jgi:RND family efflux transporter MFP subunit
LRHTVPTLLLAALAVAGCQKTADDPRTLPPLVSVIAVHADAGAGETFTGVVRARIESALGFRVAGKIAERLVDPGQTVRRGQALMRLDPSDLALDTAAQAANVAAAKAKSVRADADLKRLLGLVEQGAIAAQTYDQAKADADSAKAQLATAEAQAKVAVNARSYAVLTADADGVVQEVLAEPGQVVSAGQSIVKLAHAGPREAAVDLPETVRPALGSSAQAFVYGRDSRPLPARLRQLSQSADPVTRTYEARYVPSGAGEDAPLGATVSVALSRTSERDADQVSVPLGALYDPGPSPGVWLVRDDHVAFQPVKVMGLAAESATITGVTPGARVVALGADQLRQGQRVRPLILPGVATAPESAR